MEEKKSMGGALIDVFDAALVLVKSELSGLIKKLTAVIKAKGLGVVLMLGAVGPLLLGLVFLILFVFYGLMRLGLGAWAAALLIALFSFALTAALIFMGLSKLTGDADLGQPKRKEGPMTEDERLEAQYQAEKRAEKAAEKAKAEQDKKGAAHGTAGAGSVPLASVSLGKARESEPVGVPGRISTTGTSGRDPSSQYTDQNTGGVRPNPEIPRDAINYAAGESRVLNAEDGAATVRVEGGTVTVPVYETDEDGKPQMYSTGINDKLEGSTLPSGPAPAHGSHGHKKHDPNLQEPVVLKDAPGIPVSTAPTYREDMREAQIEGKDKEDRRG